MAGDDATAPTGRFVYCSYRRRNFQRSLQQALLESNPRCARRQINLIRRNRLTRRKKRKRQLRATGHRRRAQTKRDAPEELPSVQFGPRYRWLHQHQQK